MKGLLQEGDGEDTFGPRVARRRSNTDVREYVRTYVRIFGFSDFLNFGFLGFSDFPIFGISVFQILEIGVFFFKDRTIKGGSKYLNLNQN